MLKAKMIPIVDETHSFSNFEASLTTSVSWTVLRTQKKNPFLNRAVK